MKTFKLFAELFCKHLETSSWGKLTMYAEYILIAGASLFGITGKNIMRYILRKTGFEYILIMSRLKESDRMILHHPTSYTFFFDHLINNELGLDKLQEGSVYVDIGANIGLTVLLASKKAKRIYAFEPEEHNFQVLTMNIDNNNLHDKVQLYKTAVSDKDETAMLYVRGSETSNLYVDKGGFVIGQQQIKCVSLDRTLFNEYAIDLIKIDVEGAEADILRGAKKILQRTKRLIVEARPRTKGDCCWLLTDAGFSLKGKGDVIFAEREST